MRRDPRPMLRYPLAAAFALMAAGCQPRTEPARAPAVTNAACTPADGPPLASAAAAVEAVPTAVDSAAIAITDAPPVEPLPEPKATSSGRVPSVRMSETMVGPSYPPDLIKAVMRRTQPGFRKCVADVPAFGPRGTLTFTIEADGRVKNAGWMSGTEVLTPSASQQCVLDVLRAMEFPQPHGRVIVRYPWASDQAF